MLMQYIRTEYLPDLVAYERSKLENRGQFGWNLNLFIYWLKACEFRHQYKDKISTINQSQKLEKFFQLPLNTLNRSKVRSG